MKKSYSAPTPSTDSPDATQAAGKVKKSASTGAQPKASKEGDQGDGKSKSKILKVAKAIKTAKKISGSVQDVENDADGGLLQILEQAPPSKLLAPKNWTRLQENGWDPRSVEFLGMVDKETISNLTRNFMRVGSCASSTSDDKLMPIGRSASDSSTMSTESSLDKATQKKRKSSTAATRRYVVHGSTADGKSIAGMWTTEPEEIDAERVAAMKMIDGIPIDGTNFFDHAGPASNPKGRARQPLRVDVDFTRGNQSPHRGNNSPAPGSSSPIGVRFGIARTGSPDPGLPSLRGSTTPDGTKNEFTRRSKESPTNTERHSPSAVGNIRSLLKGINASGDELKGVLSLRSSLSENAALENVFCEVTRVTGSKEQSCTSLHKFDAKTLEVSLHPEASMGKKDALTILHVSGSAGKEGIYLQAANGIEAKQWLDALKAGIASSPGPMQFKGAIDAVRRRATIS